MFPWRPLSLILFVGATMTGEVSAQAGGPRTLDELKAETQRRADRNLGPLTGVKPEDARDALSRIHSLDRDEWALAWMSVGQRFLEEARKQEANAPDAARVNYLR